MNAQRQKMMQEAARTAGVVVSRVEGVVSITTHAIAHAPLTAPIDTGRDDADARAAGDDVPGHAGAAEGAA